MGNVDKEVYETISRVTRLESEMSNVERWNDHQNDRMDKLEEVFDSKIHRLEDKIDKIIENERKLLETINETDSSLDEKIDERFNKLQTWLLATAASAGIGLLMFILEFLIK